MMETLHMETLAGDRKVRLYNKLHEVPRYSRIKSIKPPSFCMTTFSATLTNLMVLLPQSHNCSFYVSRRILISPPFWLQKHMYIRAHDLAYSPDLWHQPKLANVTCTRSWRLCGINYAIISELHNIRSSASAISILLLSQHLRTPVH
jgi:hypothetical protein